ncbi:MAG: transglycosylase domain-containing protein [Lachnospiraceae bacterium]|nr:transglycosylase domain-containing protein [Lachnospiraceae bacterium]
MNYGRSGVRAIQRALNSKTNKLWKSMQLSVVWIAILCAIGVGICGAALAAGLFKGILEDTPRVRLGDIIASGQATIVYDCEGNEIDTYVSTNSNRIQVTWDKIPRHLALAFVACEDERFYQHNGIDIKAIGRSGFQYIKSGFRQTQGGSTITQQLLKNTVFTGWTEEGHNLVKKIKRKIQEQYLALEVTKSFTKDEILLRYMNAINLGQNTLGVESASLRYFGKSCSELTISEAAVIAVITQNPSGYNPISRPENNARRRKNCLDKMKELGFITEAQYNEAIADTNDVYERIGLFDTSYRVSTSSTGSYFSDAVYKQVYNDLIAEGYTANIAETLLTSGGLRIESTLDPTIQAICDEEAANPNNYPAATDWYLDYALTVKVDATTKKNFSKQNMMSWFKSHKDKDFNLIFHSKEDAYAAIDEYRAEIMSELGVENVEKNYEESISMTPQPQVAFVVSDPKTGYIVAVVGGRGAKAGRLTLNRATKANRSPGSTFKVLASFAPALDCAGMTLATVYEDKPFSYDDGTPVRNWYGDSTWRGIRSIRYAIEQSMNIIAVKNLTVITPQLGFDYLTNFGFTTLESGAYYNGAWMTDINQSLALGGMTNGVSPYELNAAYASIGNSGTYYTPKFYSRVLDSDGNVILDNTNPKGRQVLKETTAYLLTNAMQDVITKGTATACKLNNMNAAGKTGTTTKTHDVWFAGFTPYYSMTVWTGYDNNIAMNTKGANAQDGISKKLWKAVMSRIHEELPNQEFPVPDGIVKCKVCSQSGLLPNAICEATGCVYTELFADGTQPTTQCTVHYEGEICAYDNLIACDECPFKYHGQATLPLVEDPSLTKGSTMIVKTADGGQTLVTPSTGYCQHNSLFFLKPGAEQTLAAQQAELQQRIAAAQAGQ